MKRRTAGDRLRCILPYYIEGGREIGRGRGEGRGVKEGEGKRERLMLRFKRRNNKGELLRCEMIYEPTTERKKEE